MLKNLLIISGKPSQLPAPSRFKATNYSPVNSKHSILNCQSTSWATGNCLLPSVSIATQQ